jgi:hypothetical protein
VLFGYLSILPLLGCLPAATRSCCFLGALLEEREHVSLDLGYIETYIVLGLLEKGFILVTCSRPN